MMINKLTIVFILFLTAAVSFGCIESQKLPSPNETATPGISEQKLPAYNETKPLKINDTFETWSRGYTANYYERQPYFKIITNYSNWISFLTDLKYFEGLAGGGPRFFEGQLFPGLGVKPKTINPDDFKDNFIIASMMGLKGMTEGPEIEIKNISRINNTVNVTVRMYEPTAGASAMSSPYHIVIVKREMLPVGNSTFVFTDTEGKTLGKVEVNIEDGKLIEDTTLIQEKIKSKLIGMEITYSGKWGQLEKFTVNESDIKMMNETWLDSKRVWKVRIGVGISWDYYFDENGENIVKVEQLFYT